LIISRDIVLAVLVGIHNIESSVGNSSFIS
jgi:hypothetical protein